MRFAWIDQHQDAFDIACMCRSLEVSRSGFCAWQKRPAGPKATHKDQLMTQIRQTHEKSHGIYGSPRIAAHLAGQGCHATPRTKRPRERV